MNKLNQYIGAAALCFGVAAAPQMAQASSHREAPAIAQDPAADNTDLWAWTSKDKQLMYIVAAWNPLEEPAGGPNFNKFADEVLYEIHITPTGHSVADKITYQFRFRTSPIGRVDVANLAAPLGGGKEFFSQLSGQKQTYSVTKVTYGDQGDDVPLAAGLAVAPVNIGPRTDAVAYGNAGGYTDAYAKTFLKDLANGEGQVWAGPRDDGFYVDLGGVFDLANLRAKGVAQDGVNHYNCHAIAMAIPTALLTDDGQAPGNTPGNRSTVGVWASSSRRQVSILNRNGTDTHLGPWVQVSRLGLPLVNEAVIGLQDKDKYNRTRPTTDVGNFGSYFLNPIIVRDAKAVGIYDTALKGLDSKDFQSGRKDILDAINLNIAGVGNIAQANTHDIPIGGATNGTGDVLRVDMAAASSYPNGRPLGATYTGAANKENDVTDITLSLFLAKLTKPVSDGVDYNDVNYLDEMPFLALPWRGFDQGHGKPTP